MPALCSTLPDFTVKFTRLSKESSFGLARRVIFASLRIPEIASKPDTSPITPGTAEKAGGDIAGDQVEDLNVAQRIEQRLWKYSTSRNFVKRWLLEITSWSLSAVCMAGIVAVLIVYQNKRIPHWPLGLTLNAYISVLSKVASAALLVPVSEALGQLKWSWFRGDNFKKSKKLWDFEIFDSASRGPWGSFLLLLGTRGRTLAALGAAVTLFAIALDPFFQQVVEYPEHWCLQPGTGTIPRATGYEPYGVDKEYRLGLENLELDQNMLGAVHHFFYNNGTLPMIFGKGIRAEIPLSCPNSKCTWPEYETLGVCSECIKATDLLEFKCANTTLDWVQVPDEDPDSGETAFPNGTSCGWYLKAASPLLMTGYDVDRDTAHAGEILLMRAQPLYDVFTREPLPGYPAKLNNSRNPLTHVIIVAGESLESIQRNATPIAHECILSCYTENITSSFVNGTLGPSPWVTYPTPNKINGLSGTNYFYTENITVRGESGFEYHVDNYTHTLTLSLFDDIFPSSYTLANKYITIGPFTRNVTYNPFMFANISIHMDLMATAMTNLMRSLPSNIDMKIGPAFEKESFVDVRWAWLSLPLALLGLTCIFLVATIVRSLVDSENVGVWKTSAIAVLLYGLPDEMQKKITEPKENGHGLRVNVKQTKVSWLPKGGWSFSGSSPSPTLRGASHDIPTKGRI
ncbi:uncharacterized protein BDR25DRAFT_332506 [Lindgomyces ingoldianus]|uniref:Uncharacterized protein n=1 Tax=Lindgomyces ingoldianus TaxID=673940 RepID=A0ACB6R3I5_9PLEO|nr:uncharacterized protein BDR25DRAFT_332506 [Lindgomyces ingoldianus]KAF2473627.1 hypothetical protein BDR25DRAFT_332506 [Lindgomyces ingoldianus]